MRVLHSSDLHGNIKKLLKIDPNSFDIWIDTGDLLSNYGRHAHTNMRIDAREEIKFQNRWLGFKLYASRVMEWLDGRPFISVQGNHDYLSFAGRILNIKHDYPAYELKNSSLDLMGFKFHGFPNIPLDSNEWNHETNSYDINKIVWNIPTDTDILLTHAPPGGILSIDSGGEDRGISCLSHFLSYVPTSIKHHFFGHVHGCGGQDKQINEIQFHNSATHIRLIDVENNKMLEVALKDQ